MKKSENGLKKFISANLPNEGKGSCYAPEVVKLVKQKHKIIISKSLVYALVNDHAAITHKNKIVVEAIMEVVKKMNSDLRELNDSIARESILATA